MSDNDQSAEKTEEPTLKRLQDARAQGEIPKSVDLTTAVALSGLLLALMGFSTQGAFEVTSVLKSAISNPEGNYEGIKSWGDAAYFPYGIMKPLFWLTFTPAIAAIIALAAQNSIVFSGKKLQPKLSKISPISALKNKFGRAGLFEFSKSALKLTIFSIAVGAFILLKADKIVTLAITQPTTAVVSTSMIVFEFMTVACVIMLLIGALDFSWQYRNHFRKNMMSRKEVQDEQKDAEGDPHTKGQRRQKGYEIAMNHMLGAVSDADVVIVNPTHYAVALKWEPLSGHPPICVAKGTDDIAARIRNRAKDTAVPIYRSPATARSIYAKIEIGSVIEKDDFSAVAAAIRFAQEMRRK